MCEATELDLSTSYLKQGTGPTFWWQTVSFQMSSGSTTQTSINTVNSVKSCGLGLCCKYYIDYAFFNLHQWTVQKTVPTLLPALGRRHRWKCCWLSAHFLETIFHIIGKENTLYVLVVSFTLHRMSNGDKRWGHVKHVLHHLMKQLVRQLLFSPASHCGCPAVVFVLS